MAPNKRQAIIWTNDDPVHWRINAALGGDELKESIISKSNLLDKVKKPNIFGRKMCP